MSDSVRESTGVDGSTGRREAPHTRRLDEWLSALAAGRGSDLLLVAGVPASIRFEGRVQPIGSEKLSGAEIEARRLAGIDPARGAAV